VVGENLVILFVPVKSQMVVGVSYFFGSISYICAQELIWRVLAGFKMVERSLITFKKVDFGTSSYLTLSS